MIRTLYTMRCVSRGDYANYKQIFEEKYGILKHKKTDIFGNTEIEFYNDELLAWSYEIYFYGKPQTLPMPLFQEQHSGLFNSYFINDKVIEKEKYDVKYCTIS